MLCGQFCPKEPPAASTVLRMALLLSVKDVNARNAI